MMDASALISEIVRRDVSPGEDEALNDVVGWDSLKGVRLVLRLEEIVGRQLSESEIERLLHVRDVDAILKQTAGA